MREMGGREKEREMNDGETVDRESEDIPKKQKQKPLEAGGVSY